MNEEFSFSDTVNGTIFTIHVKDADGVKLTYEELIKKIISEKAVALEADKSA